MQILSDVYFYKSSVNYIVINIKLKLKLKNRKYEHIVSHLTEVKGFNSRKESYQNFGAKS